MEESIQDSFMFFIKPIGIDQGIPQYGSSVFRYRVLMEIVIMHLRMFLEYIEKVLMPDLERNILVNSSINSINTWQK